MKINYFFMTLLSLVLIFSCKTEKEAPEIPILKLEEVLEGDKVLELSDICSKIETVQLETNDDILINRIANVILSNKNIIVVHDNLCSVFDLDGNYIRKISSKGQGPEEYISIDNVFVSGDTIRIADFSKRKIHAFNLDGSFLFSIEVPANLVFATAFDDMFFCYRPNRSGSETTKLYFIDRIGNLLDSIPNQNIYENPFEIISIFYDEIFMYQFDGSINMKEMANDTLFAVSKDRTISPLYIFDLGKYAPKEKERYVTNLQEPSFQGKKLFSLLLETTSHFVINARLEKDRYILYDKKTKSLENVAFRYNDEMISKFGNEFFNPKYVTHDGKTFCSHEVSANIDNDDNPVLIFATFF